MESIDLRLDEDNELVFDVDIQGTDAPNAAPEFRFVCEGPEIDYSFRGSVQNGKVVVNVPAMKGMLAEGSYPSRLEIIIDDRYFSPMQIESSFQTSLKVRVEGVAVNKTQKSRQRLTEKTTPTQPRVKGVSTRMTRDKPPRRGKKQPDTLASKFKKK